MHGQGKMVFYNSEAYETGKMKWLELHVWRQTNKVNKQSKQTK